MAKSVANSVKKYVSKVNDLVMQLRELEESLQEYYDERSERWQESEAGEQFSDDIYAVTEFTDALENACCKIIDSLSIDL